MPAPVLPTLIGIFSLVLATIGRATADESADESHAQLRPSIRQERSEYVHRERIEIADIRSDGGYGYVARLRDGRPGDKEGSAPSVCRLLENGVPLPHPHSRHNEIRESGAGRYSHWTESSLYFSASDSSDPRTNGRRYELVSDRVALRKTARLIAKSKRSRFEISTPEDSQPRPLRTTFINRCSQRAVTVRLARRGDPDLSSCDSILASILDDQMSDEQRAIAIWKFLVDWRYHDYPAESYGEIHDPVKLINVYGYGFCDDSAAAFCQLASAIGLKTRSYGLDGHVVAEVFYDDAWHMFDPDHQVFYRNSDQQVASVTELERHPEWITREPIDPTGYESQKMAELYTSRDNNRHYQSHSIAAIENRMVLHPGDQVSFHFDRQEKVHRRIFFDQPLPKRYGNGRWSTTIDSLADYHLRWPYVILSGRISAEFTGKPAAAVAKVSLDGVHFTPIDVTLDGSQLELSLDAWIESQPTAVYDCWLRLPSASYKSKPRVEIDFQFAPLAHAPIQAGENPLELFLDSPHDQPLTDWEGVEAEIVWEEIEDR